MPIEASMPTAPKADGATAYHLGNLALLLGWTAGIAVLLYGVVTDSTTLRWAIIGLVGVPVMARTGLSLARAIRRKTPKSDAAVIADLTLHQDERQRHLSTKAGALAGAVALGFPMLAAYSCR